MSAMLRRKSLVWLATRRVFRLAWHLVCKRQIVQVIISRFLSVAGVLERVPGFSFFSRGRPFSIRTRLIVGAALILAAFVVVAGLTLERAYSESVLTARYAKLQSDVYILMAAAEVDTDGTLIMPPTLAEPRFALPASGLYANIENMHNREEWQSASTVGQQIPFVRHLSPGEWHFGELSQAGRRFLGVAYGVNWSVGKKQQVLTFATTEDDAAFRRELLRYRTTLWSWLGGVVVGLLLAQTVLLSWGLAPLRRVAREIRRVETGDQSHVRGVYPVEIAGLTDNLNALIVQERARQSRYKDALGDLAHSLKTPLAVLRSALLRPECLAQSVEEQVSPWMASFSINCCALPPVVRRNCRRACASPLCCNGCRTR